MPKNKGGGGKSKGAEGGGDSGKKEAKGGTAVKVRDFGQTISDKQAVLIQLICIQHRSIDAC